MRLTSYHAKYFAHDLTHRPASGMERLSMSLFDAIEGKFSLPVCVLNAKAFREAQRSGRAPLAEQAVLIMSFNYANSRR